MKKRHNPNKRANNINPHCGQYDIINGHAMCERGVDNPKCNGNAHSCCKVDYHKQAIIN